MRLLITMFTAALSVVAVAYVLGWFIVGSVKPIKSSKRKKSEDVELVEVDSTTIDLKREEAFNLFNDWNMADSKAERSVIQTLVCSEFGGFDEKKLNDPTLQVFILECKYKCNHR